LFRGIIVRARGAKGAAIRIARSATVFRLKGRIRISLIVEYTLPTADYHSDGRSLSSIPRNDGDCGSGQASMRKSIGFSRTVGMVYIGSLSIER
jgi:hypothetical protein